MGLLKEEWGAEKNEVKVTAGKMNNIIRKKKMNQGKKGLETEGLEEKYGKRKHRRRKKRQK